MSRAKVVHFKVLYDTTKMEYFCNVKGPVPLLNQSNIVYEFCCPGCSAKYIGKTERTLHERSMEHAWYDKNSAICHHIGNCDALHNT